MGIPGNYGRQLPRPPGSVPHQQAAGALSHAKRHNEEVPRQGSIVITRPTPKFVVRSGKRVTAADIGSVRSRRDNGEKMISP